MNTESKEEKWLREIINFPMDEPVTAKIMQKPIQDLKERLAFVTGKLKKIEQPKHQDAYLLVIMEKIKDFWYRLPNGKQMTIGRNASADLVIKQPEISRNHCVINRDEHGITIMDLNSRNGIIVNNKKVSERQLCNGDVITLGPSYLIFVDNSAHVGFTSTTSEKQ